MLPPTLFIKRIEYFVQSPVRTFRQSGFLRCGLRCSVPGFCPRIGAVSSGTNGAARVALEFMRLSDMANVANDLARQLREAGTDFLPLRYPFYVF